MAGSSTIGYLEWNPNFYMLALSSSIALSILSLSLFRLSLFRILRAENRRSTETCVGGSAVSSSATSLNSAKENTGQLLHHPVLYSTFRRTEH